MTLYTFSNKGGTDVPASQLDSNFQQLAAAIDANLASITDHVGNTANPHAVTVDQIGAEPVVTVGSVDQLWQGDKVWVPKLDLPISTPTQDALDLKSPLSFPAVQSTFNRDITDRFGDSYLNLLDYFTSKANLTAARAGTAPINSAIDDGIAAVQALGYRGLYIPPGNWFTADDTVITNPGMAIIGDPSGRTILNKSKSGRFFETLANVPIKGTGYLLQSDIPAGSSTIPLTPTAALSIQKNTFIILCSNAISVIFRDGEFLYVTDVNTTTGVITIAGQTEYAYTTANAAEVLNMVFKTGVRYKDLFFDASAATPTSPQRPPFNVDDMIAAWGCLAPEIIGCGSRYTFAPTVNFHLTVNALVDRLYARDGYSDGTDMTDAYSYAVCDNGLTRSTRYQNSLVERCRHGYTTGAYDSSDATMFPYGDPAYTMIANCSHFDAKEAGWDGHQSGHGGVWSDLKTIGGIRAGFQIRNQRQTLIDCVAENIVGVAGTQGYGFWIVGGLTGNQYAQNTRLINPKSRNTFGDGIRDQAPGTIITNALIENSAQYGIYSALSATGNTRIHGALITNCGSALTPGTGAAAVVVGNAANQTNVLVENVTVDDPNNYLNSIVRRPTATTQGVKLVNLKGLNSTGANILLYTSATNNTGVEISPPLNPVTIGAAGATVISIGSTLTNLMTTTAVANAFRGANSGVRLEAWGRTANNANAKTLSATMGGSVVATFSLPVSIAGSWKLILSASWVSASVQAVIVEIETTDATGITKSYVNAVNASIADTASIAFITRGQGVADGDIEQRGQIMSYL